MGLFRVRIGGPFPLTLRHIREMSESFDESWLFLPELGGEMYGCLDLPVSWGKTTFLRAVEVLDHPVSYTHLTLPTKRIV